MPDVEQIARGLTKAQRAYLIACGASEHPYKPRHGRTANWAVRHGFAHTCVRPHDGTIAPWKTVAFDEAEKILGERLSDKGLAVRAIITNALWRDCPETNCRGAHTCLHDPCRAIITKEAGDA